MNLEFPLSLIFLLSLIGGLAIIVALPLWLSRYQPKRNRMLRQVSGSICLLLSMPYLLLGFTFFIPAISSQFTHPLLIRALTFSYGLALIVVARAIWPKTSKSRQTPAP